MKLHHFYISALIAITLLPARVCQGQNTSPDFTSDSVDLQTIVQSVVTTHPTVIKAQEAIQTVEAGIGMAKSAYYPDIDFGAGYTRIGPVPEITIPNMGTFDMAPANNYIASLNIRQTVYDFSKTEKSILIAESNKAIAEKNIDLVKQRLSLLTITNYYALVYLQEAVHIKDLQLGILYKHLDFVTRKRETGSATDYEVLSTKVRISAAKNQKLNLETSLNNQLSILNSLLGLPEGTRIIVRNRLMAKQAAIQYDSLVSYALGHRNDFEIVNLREQQAKLSLESVKIENNPVLSAFASGGMKDGYFPDMNTPKANYAAGLALKIPIFTATRHKYQMQMASTNINIVKQDIEQTRREISAEVFRNVNDLQSSLRMIEESSLQLEQAEEARKLADLSFKAGTITNLDLLDSQSIEAESRLSVTRAKTEFMISSARLEISIGNPGY
jgi:outer membrane protein